jgi:hypothetical protein
MEHFQKDIRELIEVGLALGLACLILYLSGIGCPIRFLTGICCPGCGISRAILAAVSGDLQAAFYFHPLFWFPFLYVILWLFRRNFDSTQVKVFLLMSIMMYLVVYLFRMVTGSEVVVCRPQTGLIYKIISGFFNKQA